MHHSSSRRFAAIVVSLLWVAFPAAAIDVLYRADHRAPDVVFANGFWPSGTNRNALDHVSGRSCYLAPPGAPVADRTAFIGLAERPDQMPPLDYVYRITPDARAVEDIAAYDVRRGLAYLSAARESLRLDLRQLAEIDALRASPVSAGQYLSRRIPPELVQSVDIYQRDPVTYRRSFVRSESNPRWVRPQETGTRSPFPPSMAAAVDSQNNIIVYYVEPFSDRGRYAIGACHADCARAAKRDVANAAGALQLDAASEDVCTSDRMFDGRDIFSRTLQVILD